jgi:hypothetical protein
LGKERDKENAINKKYRIVKERQKKERKRKEVRMKTE